MVRSKRTRLMAKVEIKRAKIALVNLGNGNLSTATILRIEKIIKTAFCKSKPLPNFKITAYIKIKSARSVQPV